MRASGASIDAPPGVVLTAGRGRQCEIHLDDQSVSRRHCTLEAVDGGIRVTDLGSANGTFINEQAIESGTARAGDVIRVGASALDVRADEATDAGMSAQAVGSHDRAYESVIQKRFEPTRF